MGGWEEVVAVVSMTVAKEVVWFGFTHHQPSASPVDNMMFIMWNVEQTL